MRRRDKIKTLGDVAALYAKSEGESCPQFVKQRRFALAERLYNISISSDIVNVRGVLEAAWLLADEMDNAEEESKFNEWWDNAELIGSYKEAARFGWFARWRAQP